MHASGSIHMQNLDLNKSFEHFHLMVTDGRTHIVIKVHTKGSCNYSNASFIKKGCYACQWLDNVDMHTFAKFD